MGNIRKLNFLDKNQLKKIAGFANSNSNYFKYNLLKECACSAQDLLPLNFKIIPESFVSIENKELKGMISVCPTSGNAEQINILRLLFENDDYQTGKDLIEFIVHKYGELGAKTFKVIIDNNLKDLERLFMNGCGFRCCSYENLWDVTWDLERFSAIESYDFVLTNDSHAKIISELANSELVTHYKPALERPENEFKDPILKIFDSTYENRYILTDNGKTMAYLTIKTHDNENFIMSLTKNSGFSLDYDKIIAFAVKRIKSNRNSEFKLYLKQKKYLKFASDYENYMHEHKYECIQTQHVLVKEFYKPVKQEFRAFVFGEGKIFSN